MIATTIRTPPLAADFVALAEYQSQTPESFVNGKPVLHLRVTGAMASAPREQVAGGSLAIFPADSPAAPAAAGENGADTGAEELVEDKVDVFVTSEYAISFCGNSCPFIYTKNFFVFFCQVLYDIQSQG